MLPLPITAVFVDLADPRRQTKNKLLKRAPGKGTTPTKRLKVG